VPNYRRYAGGSLVSNTGTWMGRVGQDWLVLTQLTDHSATALGTVTGLQFAPFLLLAPWSGALADRYPKRLIMLVTQAVMMAAALVLGVLTVGGWVRLWEVDVAAAVTGIAAAIDAPARQSFVSEIVDAELVSNAVALNSASFNGGRIVGPAVAGLVIARWDTGVAMLLNAASFLVVIAALLALDRSALHPAPPTRGAVASSRGCATSGGGATCSACSSSSSSLAPSG
jgi:MFS family permease